MANINLTRIAIALALIALVFIHATNLKRIHFLTFLDDFSYVLRMIADSPDIIKPKVVYVAVDDKSLNEGGSWPWPQEKIDNFFSTLTQHYKPQVVGINTLNWPHLGNEKLEINPEASEQNTTPLALGYYFSNRIVHGIPVSPLSIEPAPIEKRQFNTTKINTAHAYYGSNPIVGKSYSAAGFTNINTRDPTSIVQKIPLFTKYRNQVYESFPMAVLRIHQKATRYELQYQPESIKKNTNKTLDRIKIGEFLDAPVDTNGNVITTPARYNPNVLNVSAIDILNRKIKPSRLAGTIVLIGISTPNIVNIPEQTRFITTSPTALHASLIANILGRQLKHEPAESRTINLLMLASISICLLWANLRLKPIGIGIVTTICGFTNFFIHYYTWTKLDLALPAASQTFLFVSITFLFIISRAYSHWRKLKSTATAFRNSVSPEIVRELVQQHRVLPQFGEIRSISALSCSIRSYETIKEKLTPYQFTRLTNQYLTRMNESLFRHRGTIDHFRFDHIMGFWGAPVADPQHATHAVETALDMQIQLPLLNRTFIERGWKPIRLCIGVHSGMFNVANVGPLNLQQYNIFGNELEVLTLFEQLSRHYGVNVIVSEATRNAATNFLFVELDRIRFVKNAEPITIYEPVVRTDQLTASIDEEIRTYHEALASFRDRRWSEAKQQFSNIIVNYSGRLLYQVYLSRCLQFEKKPPRDEWDGIVYHPIK